MPVRRTVAAIAVALIAAACANATSTSVGSGGDISYPTDPNAIVLRIDTSGGFIAPSFGEGRIPGFSLFGDGRVIMTGAQIEIYPQPALPPVLVQTVDAAGIQQLLRAALDAGLGRNASYTDLGSVGIADAPTTTFTLAANGAVHTVRVYALGAVSNGPGSSMPTAEADARRALQAFSGKVADLQGFLPSGSVSSSQAFDPTAMRVFVSRYRAEQNLHEPAIAWPGSTGLGSFGDLGQLAGTRCGTVSGKDLVALMPLAREANQLTPWTSGEGRWALVLRPLLPDESGCEGAAR
jgi:hypothetical protein